MSFILKDEISIPLPGIVLKAKDLNAGFSHLHNVANLFT